MKKGRVVKNSIPATILFGIVLLFGSVVHELIHLLINYAQTGVIQSCQFGPFKLYQNGRPAVCLASGGSIDVNALVTPLLTSIIGLVLMYWSDGFSRPWLRWGVFSSGTYIWLSQALYSMGYFTPPMFREGDVEYVGDGVQALEAFGQVAVIPGILLIGVGVFILLMRVQYERGNTL